MAVLNQGAILGSSTIVAGVAVFPYVDQFSLLRYGVILAIVGGAMALLAQVIVSLFRRSTAKRQ